MENSIISAIRAELKEQVDENTREMATHYFKEPVLVYGVKSAAVDQIGKKYFTKIKSLSKIEIFALCEELLKSDYCEEAFIACEWSYRLKDKYTENDFAIFEHWIAKYVNNWAKCDTLCNHTIGALLEKYPQFIDNLKQWTKSNNRWLRRAAAVTLIIPAKRGQFLQDIFEISDSLIQDKDDLVQKGYGWLLKDASLKHQESIFNYVMKNRKIMPRTALRYAIERMPDDLKRKAMAKD